MTKNFTFCFVSTTDYYLGKRNNFPNNLSIGYDKLSIVMFYSNIIKIPLVSKDTGFLEDPFVASDMYMP